MIWNSGGTGQKLLIPESPDTILEKIWRHVCRQGIMSADVFYALLGCKGMCRPTGSGYWNDARIRQKIWNILQIIYR